MMTAHSIPANSRDLRIHGGNIRPYLAPLFWLVIVTGMGAVVLGLWGAMTMVGLQSAGQISVQGMPDHVFDKLVFGGLLLSSLGAFGLFRGFGSQSSV